MKIILSGIGGQGILFSTRIIAEAALLEGRKVICSETHGMAQRGASVVSHIKIGDYKGPKIKLHEADCAICLIEDELAQALEFLKPKGECYLNISSGKEIADFLKEYIKLKELKVFSIDADIIALDLDFLRGANQAVLGYVAAGEKDFPRKDSLIQAIKNISRKEIAQKNIDAFLRGYNLFKS